MKRLDTIAVGALFSSPDFLEFAEIVHALMGIPITIYAPDCKEEYRSRPAQEYNPLCALIRSHPQGLAGCLTETHERSTKVRDAHRELQTVCHAGLIDFAIPIQQNGQVVAMISCGQLLPTPPDEAGLRAFAAQNPYLDGMAEQVRDAYYRAHYLEPDKIAYWLRVISLFADHLCEMAQLRLEQDAARSSPLFLDALQYINAHLDERITLASVAAHLHCSSGYVSTLFRKMLGCTFVEYLHQQRIERAQRLLAESTLPVSFVSFESGFQSYPQFSRIFRRLVGCTPHAFRKRKQGDGKPCIALTGTTRLE